MNTTIFIDAHDPPELMNFARSMSFNSFDLFVAVLFLSFFFWWGGGGVGEGVGGTANISHRFPLLLQVLKFNLGPGTSCIKLNGGRICYRQMLKY